MNFKILIGFLFLLYIPNLSIAQVKFPYEDGTKEAIFYNYFPSRQHAFIFRNWTVVPKEKLAKVLNTKVKNIEKLAKSMGLDSQKGIEPEWQTQQGYITVLRRNWHLLPYEQLLVLLDLTREELAFRLIEDDFLLVKLGNIKPFCKPLYYEEPTTDELSKAKDIAQTLKNISKINDLKDKRFSFIEPFTRVNLDPIEITINSDKEEDEFHLRLIYSYFASFGDPLMEKDLPSYPEGLLAELSKSGINGIWIHTVLRTLVKPDGPFPGTEDADQRIEGLQNLVNRAAKYGIGVYLYVNEPRAMNNDYFETSDVTKKLKGVRNGDLTSLCTSVPEVRDWLHRSYKEIFEKVDGLAGAFTITASENMTNCASHNKYEGCDNCKNREYAKIISEVNTTIANGIKAGNPKARILVWDWGWRDEYAKAIVNNLPTDTWLMSVSEWNLPIQRGGVESVVGEYSLSAVGPGPRALKHWAFAKERGMKTVAKIQVNSSWEMAVVPAVPVLDLVAEHASRLANEDVDGVMLSWSLGGFPSINLALYQASDLTDKEGNLKRLAEQYYSKQTAPYINEAWRIFSDAFKEYPYNIQTLYFGPHHIGVANPLYLEPTNYASTMVGLPYDDIDKWRSVYSTDVYINQMEIVADGFRKGVDLLTKAYRLTQGEEKSRLEKEIGRAKAVSIHCASAANQSRFTDARNKIINTSNIDKRKNLLSIMKKSAEAENLLLQELLPIINKDSAIGYESSNHYFYLPQDLLEKYINVQYVLRWIKEQSSL